MKIIRNIDVSKIYGVSPTAVANWIDAAKEGRNQLQVEQKDDRHFILDTANNHLIMTQLSEKGRIFRTRAVKKDVVVNTKFYEVFDKEQVAAIILALDTRSEIPNKYTYINGGAEIWKAYVERSFTDKIKNTVTNTKELSSFSIDYLLARKDSKTKYNIIDIGPGDSLPMKDILSRLSEQDLINKYIAVDISPEMLETARTNISDWFGGKIPFEGCVADVSEHIIRNISFYNSFNSEGMDIVNLFFFVGSTLENQIDAQRTLLNLRESLKNNDYLILGQSLDSQQAQTYFDFGSKLTPAGQKLYQKSKWIPDLLGIDEEFYHVERYFDGEKRTRKTDIILNIDLTIKFETDIINKTLEFNKGDRITVWRHSHHSFTEVTKTLSELNLFVEFYAVSSDKAQIITVSGPSN